MMKTPIKLRVERAGCAGSGTPGRRGRARRGNQLFRQTELLIKEFQHRVANSLQIIASILDLRARAAQSEEARQHLAEARWRVMSIATVQQQLQGLHESVEIKPYLSQLCGVLAGLMIDAPPAPVLLIEAAPGALHRREAFNIGMIVVELVLNALKHAFPDGRSGQIHVKYDARGRSWQVAVSDNGVGFTVNRQGHRMGMRIIEALARQIGARVKLDSGPRGTSVAIIRRV
jgi:two-component system, sensor histidine kinase PdtaS